MSRFLYNVYVHLKYMAYIIFVYVCVCVCLFFTKKGGYNPEIDGISLMKKAHRPSFAVSECRHAATLLRKKHLRRPTWKRICLGIGVRRGGGSLSLYNNSKCFFVCFCLIVCPSVSSSVGFFLRRFPCLLL